MSGSLKSVVVEATDVGFWSSLPLAHAGPRESGSVHFLWYTFCAAIALHWTPGNSFCVRPNTTVSSAFHVFWASTFSVGTALVTTPTPRPALANQSNAIFVCNCMYSCVFVHRLPFDIVQPMHILCVFLCALKVCYLVHTHKQSLRDSVRWKAPFVCKLQKITV